MASMVNILKYTYHGSDYKVEILIKMGTKTQGMPCLCNARIFHDMFQSKCAKYDNVTVLFIYNTNEFRVVFCQVALGGLVEEMVHLGYRSPCRLVRADVTTGLHFKIDKTYIY